MDGKSYSDLCHSAHDARVNIKYKYIEHIFLDKKSLLK